MKRYVLKFQKLKMPIKKDLNRASAEQQEEYVKGKIQETECAHESYKTSSAWSIVNEISGRKGSPAAGFVLAVQRNV